MPQTHHVTNTVGGGGGGGLDEKKAEWKAINERLNMNFNSFFIMIDSNIKTAVLLAEMLYANA